MLTGPCKFTLPELQEYLLPCTCVYPSLEGPRVRSGFHLAHPPVHNPQMCLEEERLILGFHIKGILLTCPYNLVFSNTYIFYCVSESKIHCWDDRSVTIKQVPQNGTRKNFSEKEVNFWSFSGYEPCPVDTSWMERGTVTLLFPVIQALCHLSQESFLWRRGSVKLLA